MKPDIHPVWHSEANVTCACGNTWVTGATIPEIRTDICSKCHPFYTGEQRIVDTEGRVDVFMRRLQRRDEMVAAAEERAKISTVSENLALSELGISSRYMNVLEENDLVTIKDFLDKFREVGEDGILDMKGIGRGALAELKKTLREAGFDLQGATEAE